jgi:glutamyl-tRNA synthetase
MADEKNNQIRVRMAPSPTGPLHIGGVRTTLFNWLFAKQNNGVFVLRIEDTDKERSKKEYENSILEGFKWINLDWDEGPDISDPKKYLGSYGPYRQSERAEIYKNYLQKLLDDGNAYYCYCSKEDLEIEKQDMASRGLPPKYSGHCRNLKTPPEGKTPQVIRFKVPSNTKVEFKDMIRGNISFDADLFGDFIIAKDLDTPLYNFAVVVDDAKMEITHVIRGEDHISNTPKQILMQKALGFKEPIYAHIPLILNPDKSKMSKRFSDVAFSNYIKNGYLPDALFNFIAFLGWHPKGNDEVLSREEIIKQFDISKVQKAGAVFNIEKLNWLNKEYMKKMTDVEIAEKARHFFEEEKINYDENRLVKLISLLRSRVTTLKDFVELGRFFFELSDYDPTLLMWEDAKKKDTLEILKEALTELGSIPENDFNKENISSRFEKMTEAKKKGEVFWPLRVAVSGMVSSPDPVYIIEALSKDESLKRIELAIKKLEND